MNLTELKDVNINAKRLAIDIVKYQNFKTRVFTERIKENYDTYSTKTLTNYFDTGVTYIKTGIKRKMCSNKFFGYIDEAIQQHTQPLVPSEQDKRRVFKNTFTKKDVKLPVQDVINEITKDSLTEKFEYGVRVEDRIIVLSNRNEAELFMRGIKFANNDKECKLVSITELEE